jgi:hypothetical protein
MTEIKEKEYKEIEMYDPTIMENLYNAPLYKKKNEIKVKVAKGGDFVVTNPNGEKYLVKPGLIDKRYALSNKSSIYGDKNFCKAIPNPFGEDVNMKTPGGEVQTGSSDCFFADTYKPETDSLEGNPHILEKEAFEEVYVKVEVE